MIKTRYPRPIYVILRFGEALFASLSRLLNAGLLGGSTHQTTSARAYIDGQTDPVWLNRRRLIDRLFFLAPNHCERMWEAEVHGAFKTLQRAGINLQEFNPTNVE